MVPKSPLLFSAAAAVTMVFVASCRSPQSAPAAEIRIAPPSVAATKAEQMPGIHNVVSYEQGVVCGGVPEGEEGLQTLAAMGIKTIISVDGATPDVATAAKLGMRYVHLPISYDTVTPERRQQLAQAVASCEGPIYTHCHHGKHRSAAALASAMVLAGKLTAEQAQERMAVSGTAKEYTGLWQSVRDSKPLPADQLHVDPATLPSVTKVSGMVGTMAEIDMVIDLVKQAKEAGWHAPKDHPDLVAPKETARLASLFANLKQDPESLAHPAEYQGMLEKSIAASAALDAAVRAGDAATAATHLATITKSCKQCHTIYRDK